MGGSGPGELPSEWWDSLAGGEPVLGGSPERSTIQSWTWADHQVDDCFSLEPLCFPGEVTPTVGETAQLPELVVGKLEDLFLAPSLPDGHSPSRHAFKHSFDGRNSPPARNERPPVRTVSPRTPGQSDGSSSQTRADSGLIVDLQITADDRSNSVTCTITSSEDDNRRGQADSGKDSTGRMDADDISKALSPVFEGSVMDSKPASSMQEDNTSSPGLPMEVDLQCKGEQLGIEGEDDSRPDAGMHWLQPTNGSCLGFIPVTNAVLPQASSHSTDRPSAGTAEHTTSNADSAETEGGMSSSPEAAKSAGSPLREGSQQQDDAGESLTASVRDSVQSESTALGTCLEGKRRICKPGKLADAASISDMATAGWDSPGGSNRRRPGRPSKLGGAAPEARGAPAKRKRPASCKPAVPAIDGHACTQCFTNITPVWRAGPEGPKTLCNACGVRYMKVAKRK